MNKRNIALSQKISNRQLRHDNVVLKKNIRQLVQFSKRNIDIQSKMDEIGQLILKSTTLEELVEAVTLSIKHEFDLTSVTISLEQHYLSMFDSNNNEEDPGFIGERLFFIKQEDLVSTFSGKGVPLLQGGLDHGSVDFFGMRQFRRLRSQALIPLFHGDSFLGSLNLGSNDSERYQDDDGADFLKRLGQILSLALVNMELGSKVAGKN